jgi:hypothetical protein
MDGSVVDVGDQVYLLWRHSVGGALNNEVRELKAAEDKTR